jgi:hypothetical protein
MINTLEKSTHSADCINHYSLTNFQFSSGTFLFICLALSAVVADAQSYRGEAVPVVARSNPIEFSRLRFLTFVFGREGPMDAPLSTTGGATYTFTVDMVPDYVFQGTQTGRFCIYSQRVTNRAVWDALMASQAAVPYSISISDTGTFASIPSFFAQRTLYESFAAAGAFDCGPAPNVRF